MLSFRQDDELGGLAAGAGWRVVSAREAAGAGQRLATSGAAVAVIDARDAPREARAAASTLGSAIAASGGALLALVPQDDLTAIGDFYDAGATHFLTAPFSDDDFLQALRYAARHVERLAGNRRATAPAEPLGDADALTGIRDTAGARDWLERRLAHADARPLTAMLVALNRFEMVNAAYGRTAGDALLRAAFRRVEEVAAGALIARLDGPEFLVAIEDDGARIDLAAQRIASELARPFLTGDTIAVLGCRIGIAGREPDDTAVSLIRRASEALANARASDSATVRIAEAGGAEESIDALAVELRHAMGRGEIDILFQPQVSVATGAIVGVEALARWDHKTLGTIGAKILFAAAARADLEVGLSDHIQRITLERAAAWPAPLDSLRLSLNLTAGDIARPGFADLFLDRVHASGFPAVRLTVEIVESGLIEDLGAAATALAALRGAGVRVAIDDFGTGYSSLIYLKSLPLDYLKIDKQLAQDITGAPRDRVVVRGVIDMARALGLVVIVEGVETQEQLDLLAREGCQIYQGFLRSEAISTEALVALMENPA